jgi:hypothetical protein
MAASRRNKDARRSHDEGTAGIEGYIGGKVKEAIIVTYLGIPRHGLAMIKIQLSKTGAHTTTTHLMNTSHFLDESDSWHAEDENWVRKVWCF